MQLIRPVDDDGDYECRTFDHEPRADQGWVYLDAYTASAVSAVYEALGPQNRASLEKLPAMAAISLCWKLLKVVGG